MVAQLAKKKSPKTVIYPKLESSISPHHFTASVKLSKKKKKERSAQAQFQNGVMEV